MMINHEYSAGNKMISIMIIVVMMILDIAEYDITDIDDAV